MRALRLPASHGVTLHVWGAHTEMAGGIQTELSEGICQSALFQGARRPTLSGRGVWRVPWAPSAWWAGGPRQGQHLGETGAEAAPPQTASQALGPSTHGGQQGWPWGRSATGSWRARTLPATIALIPIPRPANKCKPGPGLQRGTRPGKAARPGELVWRSGREQREEGGLGSP